MGPRNSILHGFMLSTAEAKLPPNSLFSFEYNNNNNNGVQIAGERENSSNCSLSLKPKPQLLQTDDVVTLVFDSLARWHPPPLSKPKTHACSAYMHMLTSTFIFIYLFQIFKLNNDFKQVKYSN